MTELDIRGGLAQLFREELGNPRLELRSDDAEQDLPGFDSGKKVLLILATEERFGIRLRSREIDALRRFGDWVNLVSRHLALTPGGRMVPETLIGALDASTGRGPALLAKERMLDYAGLLATARGISAWLVRNAVPPGARVAIVQRDGPWAAAMLLGVSHAHAAVPLNPTLSAADYAFATADFGVAVVLVEKGVLNQAHLADVTAPVLPFVPWTTHPVGSDTPPPPLPTSPAFLLHTSGTTARPKKVVLTHERIFRGASVIAEALKLGPSDRCLTGMPMFHVHGILNALAATLVSGGSFAHSGPFDTMEFYAHLREFRPTWITAVPTMYHAIAARPEQLPADHHIRFLRTSSAPMSDVLAERLERLFGVPLLASYGMTEIDPIACVRFGEAPPRGTVGRPAGVDVRLVDPEGAGVAEGPGGEVWVRGPRVISSYEADDAVNAMAFHEGWFRTGDLARRDADGWLHISGRLKEIINRGGEKVAPLEIDAVLLQHPDVVEAAAFGVPDPALGEEIAAAVVLTSDSMLTEDGLRGWVAQRLTLHKCPRHVRFVTALPKGPTGKLLRGALRLAPAAGEVVDGDVATVCAVWGEVLGVSKVMPSDRFFDVGGSSAAALDILLLLSERLGRSLPIEVLLDGDTPAALAAAIRRYGVVPT
jgi:acyl-CoA synthetase (AMP-forming)/AMP-acid ligase II/acyl carrier protein